MLVPKTYIVITPFFPSESNFRGPYVLDQVKALETTGKYHVTVLKPKALCSKLNDYEFEGIKVHYFRRMVLPSNILPGLFNSVNKYLFLRKLKHLGFYESDISVVHAHVTENGFYANILKRKQPEIKTVLQHHGFDVLSLENGLLRSFKLHRTWVKQYGVKICNAIDLHVGVSQKTLEFLTEFKHLQPKATYVLYNGVDSGKFYPIIGLKDSKVFKIGCIANFWPLKDQMTLIKATEQLIKLGMTNLRVVFIGTGALLEDCKSYVMRNQLEYAISFEKEVTHQDLNSFYNTLDLFVLPSYYEAFGCVYTEAYACGVPFIGVKEQGIAELIPKQDEDKWLISPMQTDDLVQAIRGYYNDRSTQHLTKPIEINALVKEYLEYLNQVQVV